MLGRDDFLGRWQLLRQIDDRLGQQQGEFRGSAVLRPDGIDELAYSESGSMKLGNGPVLTAQRSYQWRFEDDEVVVRFSDGSPFHSFVAKGVVAGTDHPCGDDYYRVAYDFSSWPNWSATWDVRGPRKDYTSVSRYARGDGD